MIVLVVDDEGPGLPHGAAERIFERFYSERPASEDFGTHSGLGLSISKQIVEAHHAPSPPKTAFRHWPMKRKTRPKAAPRPARKAKARQRQRRTPKRKRQIRLQIPRRNRPPPRKTNLFWGRAFRSISPAGNNIFQRKDGTGRLPVDLWADFANRSPHDSCACQLCCA